MRKGIALAAVALLALAGPASAQTFGFGAHAGVSLPMGSYGSSDDVTEDGFASLGFSAGLDLWYPLMAVEGLSWYTSAEVAAHSLDDDGGDADGGYLIVPILTGLRFDIPAGMMSLFLTGQGGLLLTNGPGEGSELGTDFGFAVGAGAQFTENIYGGVKFYPLGDVNFSFEGLDDPAEISVSYLDIFVGFGVR